MYKCACGKEYRSKTWFQNHRTVCEMIRDTNKNEDDIYDDLPCKREMWNCLKIVLKKYETLEKKVKDHERYIKKINKKISIIDWLSDNYKPIIDFNEWLTKLNIEMDDLEYLFKVGFIEGIHKVFTKNLRLENDDIPIRCFEQKMYVFFVYKKDKWEHLDFEDYEKLVHNITGKFIKKFEEWKQDNKKFVDNEKNAESVQQKYFEIMGGKYDDETNIKKLNSKLYKHLKFNLRNIVTYEFSF